MLKLDRLLSIVLHLQSKRLVRAEELARHFGVSVRTIYRDINTLCEAGVPIASESGVGYSLLRGYHLPPVMFSDEEAIALILGSEFFRQSSASEEMGKNSRTAAAKILAILPPEKKEFVQRIQDNTSVHIRSFATPPSAIGTSVFADLQRAIANRLTITMDYFTGSRQEMTTRSADPLGVVYYSGNWHVIAHCHLRNDIRNFRADRIRSLQVGSVQYKPYPDFNLLDFMKSRFTSDNPITVKVFFPQALLRYVTNRQYYGFVQEEQQADGVLMTFITPSLMFIAHWLLHYADEIRIEQPQELHDYLRGFAQNILRNLEGS